MKNLLLLLFTISLFACNTTESVETTKTVFSGVISNASGEKISISKGDFKEEIMLDAEGVFSAELTGLTEGLYTFRDGNERSTLYIIPGKNLHLTLDAKEFDESITYTGEGAAASNYLAKKSLDTEANRPDFKTFFSQDEMEFERTVAGMRDHQASFLKDFTDLPSSFLALENKAINFEYLLNLKQYASAHAYFTKKEEVPSSKEFLQPLEGIAMNNEFDFVNIPVYKQLVMESLREETVAATLENLKDIKSEVILSSFIEDLKYKIRPGSETLQADYEALMAKATDEEFKAKLTTNYELCQSLAKGNQSPLFNFEDRNGKMVKLEDLKGKNVYIDVWATWCGPCIREIPDLKKLEADYHGKNVEFVSISVDKMKDKEKWLKMVAEKELGGSQLFSDKDWKSDFVQGYGIRGIPRFIMLDDKGKIVSADAPRPSSGEKIRGMMDGLKM